MSEGIVRLGQLVAEVVRRLTCSMPLDSAHRPAF